jgi:chromate transporter
LFVIRTLKEKKKMIYIQLFLSFLQIGLFSFGGGYAAMPLIQGQVVTTHQWLSMSEFTDLITISQMTPGPIAVNSATFVGIKIAGIGGAFAATAGCIFPSCIIVTVIARLYLKYRNMDLLQGVLQSLRPAVVAMIASAGVSILVTAFWENADKITILNTNWTLVVLFVLAVFAIRRFKMNPICVMILAGVAKVVVSFAGL